MKYILATAIISSLVTGMLMIGAVYVLFAHKTNQFPISGNVYYASDVPGSSDNTEDTTPDEGQGQDVMEADTTNATIVPEEVAGLFQSKKTYNPAQSMYFYFASDAEQITEYQPIREAGESFVSYNGDTLFAITQVLSYQYKIIPVIGKIQGDGRIVEEVRTDLLGKAANAVGYSYINGWLDNGTLLEVSLGGDGPFNHETYVALDLMNETRSVLLDHVVRGDETGTDHIFNRIGDVLLYQVCNQTAGRECSVIEIMSGDFTSHDTVYAGYYNDLGGYTVESMFDVPSPRGRMNIDFFSIYNVEHRGQYVEVTVGGANQSYILDIAAKAPLQ